jgi:Na+/melibiose symporter-like transporter
MLAHASRILAQVDLEIFNELGIAGAVVLTLIGLVLHTYQFRHRISMEERVKDSKLTEAEARRQIRFYQVLAPAVTMIGIALLALAIFDLSD